MLFFKIGINAVNYGRISFLKISFVSFHLLLLVSLFLCMFPKPSVAEEMSETILFAADEVLFWGEEETIYTATKYIKRLREAPAIATVTTEEQIRNMGARNLMDILIRIPGLGVSIGNMHGKNAIESRGIKTPDTEKILIMIDGHRVNTTLTGSATGLFDDMMVENIKRVEVIRGPGSALYGANAFVAVINVVTKGGNEIEGIDLRVGGGSFNTTHYDLIFGNEGSGLKILGSIDYLDQRISKLDVKEDKKEQFGQANDWKEKRDFALKVSSKYLSFNGRHVAKKRGDYLGLKGALNDETIIESNQFFGELTYKRSFMENLHFLVKTYYDDWHWKASWKIFPEKSYPPDGLIGVPEAKNKTLGTEIQIDYSPWDINTLTVGALYENIEQYDVKHMLNFNPGGICPQTFTPGPVQDGTLKCNWNQNQNRYISAFYFQDVWKFTRNIEGTIGVRYDKYSDFGSTTNPRIGLVWNFIDSMYVKFLYGSAFRAPNFKELYSTNNPSERGNVDVKPEKIRTYEASVGFHNKKFSANITAFSSTIEDIIGIEGIYFKNFGKAVVNGTETEAKVYLRDSTYIYINHTFLQPWDVDAAERISQVPSHRGNIGFNFGLTKYFNTNANLNVAGPRPRKSADTRGELAGYEVLDLTLIFKNFFRSSEIRVSAYNMLNEKYADPERTSGLEDELQRKGVSFILEVRYKF